MDCLVYNARGGLTRWDLISGRQLIDRTRSRSAQGPKRAMPTARLRDGAKYTPNGPEGAGERVGRQLLDTFYV